MLKEPLGRGGAMLLCCMHAQLEVQDYQSWGGGGGQRAATMWTHGRDLEAVRFHLRLGFCRGSGGCSHTWEEDNIAGCWTTVECK